MTPANQRPMHPRGADRICRAALYSLPGICRCPRCAAATEPPLDDPTGQPAAAPSPKADHVALCRDTGGGLFGEQG